MKKSGYRRRDDYSCRKKESPGTKKAGSRLLSSPDILPTMVADRR
ncbi:MAG: hypothetical protein ACWA5X_07025 [bacterium]